jgi:integral membrane sensor domain MASE1
MRHLNEPTYTFVILTFILILVNTVLAYVSVRFIPTNAAGIAYVFPAVAVMVLFGLWFGGYGAFAAYVGTLIGSGVLVHENLAQNPQIAVLWAFSGLLQVLIPLVATRSFEVDLTLENFESKRDISIIILFGVIINNLIGAAWGAWSLGLLTPETITSIFSTWLIGNVIVCLVIVPLGLKLFTTKIQKSRLYVKNYWD